MFAGLADPIADGIVASLSKLTGNITGFTSFNAAIAWKWLQLLKEISRGIGRMAVLYNPSTAPHAIFLPTMQAIAPQIRVAFIQAPVADKAAIEDALARLVSTPVAGFVIMPDVASSRFDLRVCEPQPPADDAELVARRVTTPGIFRAPAVWCSTICVQRSANRDCLSAIGSKNEGPLVPLWL